MVGYMSNPLAEGHPPVVTVTIVIPAYNEESVIVRCLTAAIVQSPPAWEIIVVDNRSTDATAMLVARVQAEHPEAPIFYVQQNEFQGLVPTRNAGFDLATGDVVGRIDADSVVEPDWVGEVQRAFSDARVSAATGPVLYYDMPLVKFGLKADDALRRFVGRLTGKYRLLFGSNMAIRRESWHELRGEVCLDSEDRMHEDIDLSIHLAQRGLTTAYIPTMISGMSARRLEDSPRSYASYVLRFERTYRQHGLRAPGLRTPIWIFISVYPTARLIRGIFQRSAERVATAD